MSINVEQIARECHEANKKYCEQIGDFSQPTWEDAPEWQKKSAMQGVQYFIENPDATPETMHENWKRVKVEDGWVYGQKKDPIKKTHHCLVPYEDLPQEQREKDSIFISIVQQYI